MQTLRSWLLPVLFCSLLAFPACEEDDPIEETTEKGELNADVNGEAFAGTANATYSESGGVDLSVVEGREGEERTISISLQRAPGTTGTYSAEGNDSSPPFLEYRDADGTSYRTNNTPQGRITVVISAYSEEQIEGTFEGIAYTTNGADSVAIENGSFSEVPVTVFD